MRVSVGLPTCMEGMMYPVPFAGPDDLVRLAMVAEELGYHSVWGNDHMTTMRYVREKFEKAPNFWEPLVTYSYLAARTSTLRFGTGMLVLPMRRDIVVVAKQLATLDHLSKGRLILGFGVGAYREEFEALHPYWDVHRGNLLDEGIQAIKVLFNETTSSWDGRYYQFQDVEMFPKPLQQPLPIYIGGNNQNAYRRAANYGEGWMPAVMPVEQLRQHVSHFRELADENGRDFEQLDVAMQLVVYTGTSHEQAVNRFRASQMYEHLVSLRHSTLKNQADAQLEQLNLVGESSEVIERAQRLADAGVKHFCGTYFCADTVDELLEQMQIFAEEVVPHLC